MVARPDSVRPASTSDDAPAAPRPTGAAVHAAHPELAVRTRDARAATVIAVTGVAVTVVHLAAQWTDASGLAAITQVLLMPLVAAWLWTRTTPGPRSRLTALVLVALGFSWLGDAVPRLLEGDAGFLAMIGFFLVAQVIYSVAFWPQRGASAWGRAPWTLGIYGAVLVGVVVLCAQEAGPLLPAVVVYAAVLATTSVLAWGLGPVAGVGGVIFLVSDAMIALGAFAPTFDPPQRGFLVMLTYVAAQVLLAHATAVHEQATVRDEAPAPGVVAGEPG